MLALFVGYRVRALRAAVIAVAVVLASTATLAQRKASRTANTEELDWTQAMASDTRDAYVKYFKAHQNTTRLGVDKGLIKLRVTPPSSIRGATVIVGGEGPPQIQVETKRWIFTLSLLRAGEIGVIADDVVKDAGKAFESASSIGGLDHATGRFLTYYVETTFDTAIALTKEVPDSSRADGKRIELIALLRDDFSLLLVPLKDLKEQIRR